MKLAPQQFLLLKDEVPVLDVRSPGEYAHGHIPGAISFPLFSDEERAIVGTAYKQQGRDIAFELGLRFVGPKMEDFVKSARKIARDGRLGVHCWRGGQRSGAMGGLAPQAGLGRPGRGAVVWRARRWRCGCRWSCRHRLGRNRSCRDCPQMPASPWAAR